MVRKFEDIVTPELKEGAILHYHEPFINDYLALHCLLRKHKIKSILEIGTHTGTGTEIICNAIPDAIVYSLDLPNELAEQSLQHPISSGKGPSTGAHCKLIFTQLLGDSMVFNYSEYPCDAWFIDGEHDFDHPFHEATEAIANHTKLIVFHDNNITEVHDAIIKAFAGKDYEVCEIECTSIAYALRKD